MPNPFLAALRADHDRLLELIEEISVAKTNIPLLRQSTLDLDLDLADHLAAEESVLLPAILHLPEVADLRERTLADHVDIRHRMGSLAEEAVGSPAWWGEFRQLRGELPRHIEFEERQLFLRVADLLPEDYWITLLRHYRQTPAARVRRAADGTTTDVPRSAPPGWRASPDPQDSPPEASG
jgi:hypothetical protein